MRRITYTVQRYLNGKPETRPVTVSEDTPGGRTAIRIFEREGVLHVGGTYAGCTITAIEEIPSEPIMDLLALFECDPQHREAAAKIRNQVELLISAAQFVIAETELEPDSELPRITWAAAHELKRALDIATGIA